MRLTAALTLSFLSLSAPAAFASQVVFDPLTGRSVNATPSTGGGRAAATPIPRETVSYSGPHRPGTIVVNTAERRLYLVLADGKALKYGVGVGRPGFAWGGAKSVTRKAEWPSWTPPSQMLKRRPDLPRFMPGGPENPMGARALYLGSSLYRIHGSNEPETIGQAVSSGCIRMLNDDVIDLYSRVRVGTQVVVLR
jgi:lipoprotein-anchoring transpeptidase ErfK/SrfK